MRAALIPTWLQEFEKEAGYMTKQEEIREGMAKALFEREFSEGYWDTRMSNGDKVQWFAKADCATSYLHSRGVVIKVEKDIPHCLILHLNEIFDEFFTEHPRITRRITQEIIEKEGLCYYEPLIPEE